MIIDKFGSWRGLKITKLSLSDIIWIYGVFEDIAVGAVNIKEIFPDGPLKFGGADLFYGMRKFRILELIVDTVLRDKKVK